MAEIRIGYFLEDIGQERFIIALVNRMAREMSLFCDELHHEVRNATGGRGAVFDELRRFLRDVSRGREPPFALLVTAIDGNCRTYRQTRDHIVAIVEQTSYPGLVVCAVPDPHVERWYLADPPGLQHLLQVGIAPEVPTYKCERGRYKQALRDAIRRTGIIAPLGGLEYGPDIAETLDLYGVGRADPGFRHFVDELRAGLASLAGGQREQNEPPGRLSSMEPRCGNVPPASSGCSA